VGAALLDPHPAPLPFASRRWLSLEARCFVGLGTSDFRGSRLPRSVGSSCAPRTRNQCGHISTAAHLTSDAGDDPRSEAGVVGNLLSVVDANGI
jgi:hypothetical protein